MRKMDQMDWCVVVALIASGLGLVLLSLQVDSSEREVRSLKDKLAIEQKVNQLERDSSDMAIRAADAVNRGLKGELDACVADVARYKNAVCVSTEPVAVEFPEKRPVPVFERGRRFDE